MNSGIDGVITAAGKREEQSKRRSEGKTKHAVTFSHFLRWRD
jgi:hypothetical protein